MKHPKFTKSVKVGQSVYNPDELNRVAADFRRYIRKANRKGQQAIFYYDHVSVSKSGMTHRLKFFALHQGRIVRINYDIAALTGYKVDRDGLIVMGGTGYHHADTLIQHLFYALGLDVAIERYANGGRRTAYVLVRL